MLPTSLTQRIERWLVDHWEHVLAGAIALLVLAAIALIAARIIIRRRRKTLLQRTLDYIEDLGDQRERLAKRLRELVDENVDGEAVAESVADRVRAIQKELKGLDDAVSALKGRGGQIVKRLKR